MINCPNCSEQNFPGADECEACMSPLVQAPAAETDDTGVAALLKDNDLAALNCAEPLYVQPDEPVDQVVKKMLEAGVSEVLIADDKGKLLGIVTERDLLYKLTPTQSQKIRLQPQTIASIMTPNPYCLKSTDSLSLLLNSMAVHGFRRLPVTFKGGYKMVHVKKLFDYLLTKTS